MAKYLIVDRDRAWNFVAHTGEFFLKFQVNGNIQTKEIKELSAEEFAVLTALLKEPRVYIYSNGNIGTDPTD